MTVTNKGDGLTPKINQLVLDTIEQLRSFDYWSIEDLRDLRRDWAISRISGPLPEDVLNEIDPPYFLSVDVSEGEVEVETMYSDAKLLNVAISPEVNSDAEKLFKEIFTSEDGPDLFNGFVAERLVEKLEEIHRAFIGGYEHEFILVFLSRLPFGELSLEGLRNLSYSGFASVQRALAKHFADDQDRLLDTVEFTIGVLDQEKINLTMNYLHALCQHDRNGRSSARLDQFKAKVESALNQVELHHYLDDSRNVDSELWQIIKTSIREKLKKHFEGELGDLFARRYRRGVNNILRVSGTPYAIEEIDDTLDVRLGSIFNRPAIAMVLDYVTVGFVPGDVLITMDMFVPVTLRSGRGMKCFDYEYDCQSHWQTTTDAIGTLLRMISHDADFANLQLEIVTHIEPSEDYRKRALDHQLSLLDQVEEYRFDLGLPKEKSIPRQELEGFFARANYVYVPFNPKMERDYIAASAC